MSKHFYFLYVLKVDIYKDEWEKVRRGLIGKMPIYSRVPDLFARVKIEDQVEETVTVKHSFSPEWSKPLSFGSSNEMEKIEIEIIHKTSLRLVNNPRVGHLSILLKDLINEEKQGELLSSRGQRVVGKILLRLQVVEAKDALSAAEVTVEELDRHEEGGLFEALKEFVVIVGPLMDGIDKLSEIHSYLSSGWKIMNFLYSTVSEQFKTDVKMVELVKEMTQVFKYVIELNKNDSMKEITANLSTQIIECCLFIREYAGKGFLRRTISRRGRERINEFIVIFEKAKQQFLMGVHTMTSTAVARLETVALQIQKRTNQQSVYNFLQPENLSENSHMTCLPGTRVKTVENIMEALLVNTKRNIVWLNGPAGCGKSTIALTIAERFSKLSRLGGYIFCTRGKSQPRQLIRTIAHKLALFDASIAERLLNAESNIEALSLQVQFERLVLESLRESANSYEGPIVIVLDALDECGDANSRASLLDLFINGMFMKLPKNVRILITSRPEDDIKRSMESRSVHKLSLDPEDSKEDVALYLRLKLTSDVKQKMGPLIPKNWPPKDDMEKVISTANGLFIWASTFTKLVTSDRLPVKKFQNLVSQIRSSTSLFDLDKVYLTVFSECGVSGPYRHDICKILSVLILSPIFISAIAVDKFLGLDKGTTSLLLSGLRSVISCHEGEPIHFFHTSFSDFLTDETRSGEHYVDLTAYKFFISERCFSLMFGRRGLSVNICQLKSPLVQYENVHHLRDYISEQLECACKLWSCLCDQGPGSVVLTSMLDKLLSERILQWFEALSLTKDFDLASPMLSTAIDWARNNATSLVPMLKEARRLANKYYDPISESPPHIYLSMLPFEKNSIVAKQYLYLVSPIMEVEEYGIKPVKSLLFTLKVINNIGSISYTSDGRHIVSCEKDVLNVWDAHGGGQDFPSIYPQQPFYSVIQTFALSSDGSKVVAAFHDTHRSTFYNRLYIGVWETLTSKPIGKPIQTSGRRIYALKFVDTENGELIASCLEDGKVSLWDLTSRKLVSKFEMRDGEVFKYEDSHSGGSEASSDEVKNEDINKDVVFHEYDDDNDEDGDEDVVEGGGWGVQDIDEELKGSHEGPEEEGIDMDDDSEERYDEESEEGKSDSDQEEEKCDFVKDDGESWYTYGSEEEEIQIEDSEVYVELHEDIISCTTFSPTAPCSAYRFESGRICVWDWEKKSMVYMNGYRGRSKGCDVWDWEDREYKHVPVETILGFSPDGTILYSYSDPILELWNTVDGSAIRSIRGSFSAFAISHDGRSLATAKHGITVWDIHSGEISFELPGSRDRYNVHITSIKFSPDGERLASSHEDGEIKVWDTEIRGRLPQNSDEISSYPLQVAFTGDEEVASLWKDKILRTWDKTYTSFSEFEANRHTTTYLTLDGRRVLCSSSNETETIEIWDIKTGKLSQHLSLPSYTSHVCSYDGRVIAVMTENPDLEIWQQIEEERFERKAHFPLESESSFYAISPDGSRVALLDLSKIIMDTDNGEVICEFDAHPDNGIFSMCNSYFACYYKYDAVVHDAKSGQLIHELEGPMNAGRVSSIAFSHNGFYIALGYSDKVVVVWNTKTGCMSFGPFTEHSGLVTSLSFSHDGSRLASASYDGSVRIWSLVPTRLTSTSEGGTRAHSYISDTWAREFSSKVSGVTNHASWEYGMWWDGWIRDDKDQLLVWVPYELRPFLFGPKNLAILGPGYVACILMVFVIYSIFQQIKEWSKKISSKTLHTSQ